MRAIFRLSARGKSFMKKLINPRHSIQHFVAVAILDLKFRMFYVFYILSHFNCGNEVKIYNPSFCGRRPPSNIAKNTRLFNLSTKLKSVRPFGSYDAIDRQTRQFFNIPSFLCRLIVYPISKMASSNSVS